MIIDMQRYTFLHELYSEHHTFLHELYSKHYTFLHELTSLHIVGGTVINSIWLLAWYGSETVPPTISYKIPPYLAKPSKEEDKLGEIEGYILNY